MRSSWLIILFAYIVILFCLGSDSDHILGVLGELGSAGSYTPPYLPTRCKGSDREQLPEDGYFAAVSDGLWDNGAACGRRYQMRCISGLKRPCKGGSIVVQVVDFCSKKPCPTTLVLSSQAFNAISRSPNARINIEYAQI